MGLRDRQYMYDPEDDAPGGLQVPLLLCLVMINCLVWLIWQFARTDEALWQAMQDHFMTSLRALKQWHLHTLVTHAFSHMDFRHLVFNMLALWFFGTEVAGFYGQRNLVALYLFAGVAGGLGQVALDMQMGIDARGLGASGAVMGCAAVAALVAPGKPVHYFFIETKLKWLVAFYIVMDLAGLVQGDPGIGHVAHLAGAFAGFLFYKLDLRVFASAGGRGGILWRLRQWRGGVKTWKSDEVGAAREQLRAPVAVERPARAARAPEPLRETRVEATARPPRPASGPVDIETARRVDALLAKISREGMDALNPAEREFLRASSELYKKKLGRD